MRTFAALLVAVGAILLFMGSLFALLKLTPAGKRGKPQSFRDGWDANFGKVHYPYAWFFDRYSLAAAGVGGALILAGFAVLSRL